MKKFVTLLSAAFIAVASLATVASAAPIAEDIFKPTIEADITKLNKNGDKATITFKVNVESDLDLYFDEEDTEYWYGSGMRTWQIDFDTNDDIFVEESVTIGSAVNDLGSVMVSENGAVKFTKAIELNAAYQGKSVDELNALAFGEVTYAEFIISSWEEAEEFSEEATQTKYRSDDNGDFVIDLSATRVGTYVPGGDEPEPPVDNNNYGTAGNEFEGKATKYWTVDFAEWTGAADVSLTDGTTTKTINVTTADDSEYDIAGAVSFYVYVIGDAAAIENVYIVE